MLEKKTVSQCISSDYYEGWNDAIKEITYDLLERIRRLEDGIEEWEMVAASPGAVEDMSRENAELLQKIKQLERERDALLTIMKGYRECDFCKHGCPPEKEEYLFDLCYGCDIENCRCRNCTTKNNCWEWRGPCEINGGSDA